MSAQLIRWVAGLTGLLTLGVSIGVGWYYQDQYNEAAAKLTPLEEQLQELQRNVSELESEKQEWEADKLTLQTQVSQLRQISTEGVLADPGGELQSLRDKVRNLQLAQQTARESHNQTTSSSARERLALLQQVEQLENKLTSTQKQLQASLLAQSELEKRLTAIAASSPAAAPAVPNRGEPTGGATTAGKADQPASGTTASARPASPLDDTGWVSMRPAVADQAPQLPLESGSYPSSPAQGEPVYVSPTYGSTTIHDPYPYSAPTYSAPYYPSAPVIRYYAPPTVIQLPR